MIYFLSILSGILLSLSTPPLPTGPLIWAALVPLFISIMSAKSYRQVLLASALTGFILHAFLFFGVKNYSLWIYLLLLPLYSIPYILLGSFTFYLFRKSLNPFAASMVVACFWFLIEEFLNVLYLPYCMGLALYQTPWIGSVSVIGGSGLSALIVFANVFLAVLLLAAVKRQWSLRTVAPAIVFWLLVILVPLQYGRSYATRSLKSGPSLAVAAVQPNWGPERYIEREQDWLWQRMSHLIREAVLKTSADIVLFPESFGVYLDRKDYLDDLKDLPPVDIIIGGVNYSRDRLKTYNSAYHIQTRKGVVSVYDKRGLVPLVESAYAASEENPQIFSIGGYKWAPLVCFESLIGNRVKEQAKDSEGLLLLANETWFETKTLPFTHLASMVMRSIEYGLPAVMVGNTISMVSDAAGNFEITNYRAPQTVTFEFHPNRIETPFGEFGYVLPYLAGFIMVGALAMRRV